MDKRPETEMQMSIMVSDEYTIELAAGPELLDYPMFATLDPSGRLFVFESIGNIYKTSQQAIDEPRFRIKLLEDLNEDGVYDRATIFADSLSFPQGGVFVDGSLIASSAPDLLKLTDTNGDGVADKREVLLSGWTLNVNANSLIGPFLGPDGWLYMTSAIMGFDVTTLEGTQMKGETARIWKMRSDGSSLEWIAAGGMNNPVELAFTSSGEVIGTQTFFVEPQRGVRDALTYWTEGGIYGKKNANITRDSLPLTGDLMPVASQYSRVAPSGLGIYRNTAFGMDFKDNYFSAQFNTQQVIRHKLVRNGASFKTEDQVFAWSDNSDIHPTDVLEDADGSLLVVETGGWFILGCPLSQVSKPQLKGGIYRIRRKEASRINDPYGNNIDWASLDSYKLSEYLEDPRPFVSDRAQLQLIRRKNEAVEVFETVIRESLAADARTKAIFGLYQIGTKESWKVISAGFTDDRLEVRLAAARVAGLTGKANFVEALIEMLNSDELPAQRQAATALGQIGGEKVVPNLIKAAETASDRFLRHAIIYALISINNPDQVLPVLNDAHGPALQAALIALDQMPLGALSADRILDHIDDPTDSQTALWVASHHPEWSESIIEYLQTKISTVSFSNENAQIYSDLLVSYCGTPEMQIFLRNLMENGNKEIKLFALEIMKRCEVDPFPQQWIARIAHLTNTLSDASLLQSALELIKSREISGLESQLDKIISDPANPVSLKIVAIDALLSQQNTLSNEHLTLLLNQILISGSPTISQQAVNTLSTAKLSEDQLLHLSEDLLGEINPFLLPRLLPLFEGADNLQVGRSLATHLMDLPSLDNLTEDYLKHLFANYNTDISSYLDDLLEKLRVVRQQRLARILELEQTLAEGNEERGRVLYFGKAICSTCHTMQEGGGTLGPDLTSIHKDRSVHDIIEAIAYPGVSFVRGYETFSITTNTAEYRGIIRKQTPEMIVLGTAPETFVQIPTRDIIKIETSDLSMMPQGLDQLLTKQEFSDLMAYIMGKDLEY